MTATLDDGEPAARTDGAPLVPASPPAWSSPWELCLLIVRGRTLRTAAMVSVVVGTLLCVVNEGGGILAGRLSPATWACIAANYVVPFLVASVGYLAPSRRRRHIPG